MSNQNISVSPTSQFIVSTQGDVEIKGSFSRKEIFILLGMLVLLCTVVFHKFIFGFSVYLFKDIGSDTLNANYPSYVNISEVLRERGLPGWSFEQGLGQNVFPFSLNDPTTYFLYWLGGDKLPLGIVWVEIFKIICGGLLFASFLKKLGLHTHAAYIGGLLFAFSGFMIVGGSWYIFSTLGLYTAFILFAFEMLYAKNKWWLFPIAVALIASYNFVSLYTCGLFLLFYVVFRVCAEGEIDLAKLSAILLRMLLLGVLGIFISAVCSLPNLLQMIESPRVSGNASHVNALGAIPIFAPGDSNYLISLLMRTFSNDLLGNGSAYQGWGNFLEAPMSYCGLITLLLLPQIFVFLKARQRIVYGIFIGIFIFAEIFPWFRRGFWLFLGDYFRDFSLYVSVVFILLSMLALDRIIRERKINQLVLGASFFALTILLYFPYVSSSQFNQGGVIQWQTSRIDGGLQAKIMLFLIGLSAILWLLPVEKYRKHAQVCLLAITLAELASFSYDTVNNRNVVSVAELHQKIGYNDPSVEAIAYIRQQDKDAFFRIEKNYGSSPARDQSLNDSKMQHYFGSSSYHGFNPINYINFLKVAGVLNSDVENETRWAIGVRHAPLLQILTGVRYFLFKGDWQSTPMIGMYTEIGRFGDILVLKSSHALPMGVAYDSYMVSSEFGKLDANQRQIALLKAIVVPDSWTSNLPTMARISEGDIPAKAYSSNELAADTEKLKTNSLLINSFSNNHIEGEINTRIKQLVFFSFPFDSGWKAKVNGNDTALLVVDGGFSAVMVEPGKNVISLGYFPPFVKKGLILTLLGLFIFGVMLLRPNKFSV